MANIEKKGWNQSDISGFASGVSGGNKPGPKWDFDLIGLIQKLIGRKTDYTEPPLYNMNESDGTYAYKNLANGLNKAFGGSSRDYQAPEVLLNWAATNGMGPLERRIIVNTPGAKQQKILLDMAIERRARNNMKKKY